jgi:CopG family transcriptional regulator/antitoxin EndoAI
MHRRINVTLPEETVRLIDRVSEKGDRSRFINEAVKRYIGEMGRANLRKLLKEGSLRRAGRDRRLAEEWFLLEEADSVVLLNQIRSVDKRRLIRPLGSLKPATMRNVDRALSVSLGLVAL